MLPRDSGTDIYVGYLRSGRRFRSGKRRKIIPWKESCSTTRWEYYKIVSHLDERYFDKEEEYHPISEGE